MKNKLLATIVFLTALSAQAQWVQFDSDLMGPSDSSFGTANELSADGSILVVGLPTESTAFDEAGMVRVYEKVSDQWSQLGQDLLGTSFEAYFGQSVAINEAGDRIAVGQPLSDPPVVRIYDFDGTAWVQLGTDLTDSTSFSNFGVDLDMNDEGNRIVVGAPFFAGSQAQQGRATAYEWDGANWIELGTPLTGQANDNFAWRVVMDGTGDTFAAGTLGGSASATGYAKVYSWNGSDWDQKGQQLNGFENGDGYGSHIELSKDGNTFVGAAPYPGDFDGSVAVYEYNGSSWDQIGGLLEDDTPATRFGFNPTLNRSADVLMVGSKGTNDAGEVTFFWKRAGVWDPFAETIVGGTDDLISEASMSMDDSGTFVSISGYGPSFTDWFIRTYSNPSLGTETLESNRFALSPNPNQGSFRINFPTTISAGTVEIYAVTGQLLFTELVENQDQISLDMDLATGVYMTRISSEQITEVLRFVVK